MPISTRKQKEAEEKAKANKEAPPKDLAPPNDGTGTGGELAPPNEIMLKRA